MLAKDYKWSKAELKWRKRMGVDDNAYIGAPVKLPTVRRTRPIKKK